MKRYLGFRAIAALFIACVPCSVFAQDELDKGDTAWMLTSSVLVLFMTLPGLALFYGGLVRSKNILSVLMQCFALACMMSILWVFFGYSIAFGEGGRYWGGLDMAFLQGITADSMSGSIPESVFVMFQMTFAVITPALIVGAFAERMKFSAMMIFCSIWVLVCYAPVCHWVWGGGWVSAHGAIDFAGGTVVHINAGIAALVAAIVLGKRMGYPNVPMPPSSMVMTMIGASMPWVGWFGFNAGSQLAADNGAGMAMLVTHICTAAAALTWMFIEWVRHGKPSVLGIATGAVAGLVTITPAAGNAGPLGAVVMGIISSCLCFYFSITFKKKMGYDDSLDVFGVHGIGGIVGAMLIGIFCSTELGPFSGLGFGGENASIGAQLKAQFFGVAGTIVYTGILTFIILKVVDAVIGLRVNEESETEGLDVSLHGERGFDL